MKKALTILTTLAAIAASSFVSYEIGQQRAVQKMQAALFYDTYRAAVYNGYFVARERADAYYWSVNSIVSRYHDFLSASDELGIEPEERKKNEKLIARYYFARGVDIPAETAALFSSLPARETFPLPEIPSTEKLRSAMMQDDMPLK